MTDLETTLDGPPARNWRHAVVGNTLVATQALRRYRRMINFEMHPAEARPIGRFARQDGVTMACWLRRLVLAEYRRRGIADEMVPWLVASCDIPDQRGTHPPPHLRDGRDYLL